MCGMRSTVDIVSLLLPEDGHIRDIAPPDGEVHENVGR